MDNIGCTVLFTKYIAHFKL